MIDLKQEASVENFNKYIVSRSSSPDTRILGDEMYLKFQELGVESERFKQLLKGGYQEALLTLLEKPNSLEMTLAIRVLVGMSLGFQYAQALYEQKELELLVK